MASVKGVWKLVESPSYPGAMTVTVNFSSGEQNFSAIRFYKDSSYGKSIAYTRQSDGMEIYVCDISSGWWGGNDSSNRTIDFGSTEQTVSDTFYTWLTANGTQQEEPEPEPTSTPTTITYNGTELASLEEGQTATFSCEGTKTKTDVSILFGSKGSITYKGVTTEIEAGKTANLLCAGKKFATDVVVAVEKAEDPLNPAGVIPDGASYTVTSTGETLASGKSFPATVEAGDIYIFGDYEYRFEKYYTGSKWGTYSGADGWGVLCKNESVVNAEPILESINGKPIALMMCTFKDKTSLAIAPDVPAGAIDVGSAFANCSALTKAPVIPASVQSMDQTFFGCKKLTSITVNATPTSYINCLTNSNITEILGDCGNKSAILATR